MISIFELLSRSFSIYFKNFPRVLLVIVWLLLAKFGSMFVPTFQASLTASQIIAVSASFAFLFLLGAWTDQILINLMYGGYKNQSFVWREAASRAFKRLPSYALMTILWSVVTFIGFLLFIVPGLIFMTWYFFASPLFVVEGMGPWQSLKQSHELTHGIGWKIFSRYFLSFALLVMIFLILINAFSSILAFLPLAQNARQISAAILSILFSSLLSPIFTGVIVVLYDEVKRIKG